MASEQTKVEIGFGIGQVLSVKLAESDLKDLRKQVESGEGWFDLKTQDGSVAVNVATIVFIRIADASQSIGFGG